MSHRNKLDGKEYAHSGPTPRGRDEPSFAAAATVEQAAKLTKKSEP